MIRNWYYFAPLKTKEPMLLSFEADGDIEDTTESDD